MTAGSALVHALAALIALAGLAKIARPATVTAALDQWHPPGWNLVGRLPVARLVGFGELVVAAGVLAAGTRAWCVALAACYAVFAQVSWRMTVVVGSADCGCFGSAQSPLTGVHVVINLAFLVTAAIGIVTPPGPVWQPDSGLPHLLAAGVLTGLGYLLFTALPRLSEARKTVETR